MKKTYVAAAAPVLILTACAADGGPTCGDFRDSDVNEQRVVVMDWMAEKGVASEGADDVNEWAQDFANHCATNSDVPLSRVQPNLDSVEDWARRRTGSRVV